MAVSVMPVRAVNDVRQYDDLADQWWDTGGVFAMLHWLAAARAELLPRPVADGAVLVDLACGAGLFAPHARRLGYHHVGVDLGSTSLLLAARRGVRVARGDVTALPLADGVADVVLAGEILEHVADPAALVAQACRVLKPGGTVVVDSIASGRWGRLAAVTLAERLPGGPPRRLHDPGLFVDPAWLQRCFADHGVHLQLHGLIPDPVDYVRWLARRSRPVRLRRVSATSALFGGSGVKERV